MKFELDDPKLTAYALGELSDTEKAEVEAFLNENEAARNEVAQIRETAQWLSAELGAETPAGLSELEKARIMDQAKRPLRKSRISWGFWLTAAAILLVVGIMAIPNTAKFTSRAGGGDRMMSVAKARSAAPSASIINEGGSVSANAPVAPVDAKELRYPQNQVAQPASSPALGSPVLANAPKTRLTELPPLPSGHEGTKDGDVPAPTAAPAPASQPPDNWNTIGTKSMSSQAVIDLPEKAKQVSASAPPPPAETPAPAAAPAAAPATAGATGGLQNVTVGGELRVRGNYLAPKEEKDKAIRLNAQAPVVPESTTEQLRALGYGGVGANAPAPKAESKPEPPKPTKEEEDRAMIRNYIERAKPIPPPPPPTPVPGSESYPVLPENAFQRVADAPLSTFGLDVDTASYANMRRFLSQGTLPPGEAVRIEELINYFKYDYPKPEGDAPFSVTVDAHPCPWAPTHTLARIGVRGKELNTESRPPANLVFLIDVSGSMQDEDKLPLLKKGMKLLTQTVTANDRVSIVTYASGTGVALYPTSGDNKVTIENIIDNLQAGGSTNGAGGIQLAYDLARRAFIQGGVNRVILATDGDFNVGVSDTGTLVTMIQEQAKTGVALSVLGFGQGNLKDERLMSLADKGNGNYAYIDSFNEARKALLEQATGTLFTIAKDVKIQVEFNPGRVGAYRLVGYEKRMLAAQDFNDDRKDAGEIGAGHTVTALYELVPPGEQITPPQTDPLKYQANAAPAPAPATTDSPEMMTVKLRFKPPTGDVSTRFDVPVPATVVTAETRPDFQFASAVAAFGMLLRHSSYAGTATMDMVINLAQQGKGGDPDGLRAEFVNLARTASALMGAPRPQPTLQ